MKRTSVGKGRKAPRRAGRGGGRWAGRFKAVSGWVLSRWAGRFKAVSGWVLRVATVGGVCLGASIIFVSFYQYLLSSPHIRMEKVVFNGVPGEIQRDLMARAGLASGANLLALKLRDVRRKMETHPWVRRVALERQFPHTLL
ncbi:MAG: FtsQ-type POTRA domain-containing protein, partial [Deltaproteobacteria bacterium]|nr:FtsQ-type POTRA domain-containing protein [Deltaproteobacteria bacterium]